MFSRPTCHLGSILFAALIVAACSVTDMAGPAGPEAVGLTGAGTPSYAPAPVYQLTDFNGSTLVISATNGFGESIAVPFSSTIFRDAQLNHFPNDPLEPCRELAEDYNASSGLGDTSIYTVIGSMAANGCSARIWVDHRTSTVRAFQPTLPPSPIIPNDPV